MRTSRRRVVALVAALVTASALAACSSSDESSGGSSSGATTVDLSTSCPPASHGPDDVDFVVFFDLDADPGAVQELVADIEGHPDVASTRFYDQQQAYDEFARLFADSPELVATVSPEILPTSLRVRTSNLDATEIEALADSFADHAVVREVVDGPGDPDWPDGVPGTSVVDC